MGVWEVYAWGFVWIGVLMTLLWLVSIPLRNVSIVDIFWGLGFVLVNAWYFAQGLGNPSRKLLLLVLVTIWGLRLSGYLAWRNIGKGEDFRYQQFRQSYGPRRYWWYSYFQVFLLQGALMGVIALPLAMGQAMDGDGLHGWDYLGTAIWLIGIIFEAGGDWQLARFKANPANKGKVLDTGLWRYTRHPNYFGDAAVWWGYGLISVAAGAWWGIIGSLIMTGLIIKVSGVALLERSLKEEKPEYAQYIKRTSAFFPWFPRKG
jgi:steroid 5-alpha reductase family enzyme